MPTGDFDWWFGPRFVYPTYQPQIYQWPMMPAVPLAQRIKVSFSGHQSFYTVEGEVIQWCSTAENFSGGFIQVPAVLLKTEKSIELVPLRKDLYQVSVETLPQTVLPGT